MANPRRDIEVELTLLPTKHGGRCSPVFNNYRPQFYYAGRDWDASHEYPDVIQVNPGDTVRAFLCLLSPQKHLGRIKPGMPFLLREGQKIVGYGVVVRLLNLEQATSEKYIG